MGPIYPNGPCPVSAQCVPSFYLRIAGVQRKPQSQGQLGGWEQERQTEKEKETETWGEKQGGYGKKGQKKRRDHTIPTSLGRHSLPEIKSFPLPPNGVALCSQRRGRKEGKMATVKIMEMRIRRCGKGQKSLEGGDGNRTNVLFSRYSCCFHH